MTEGREKAGKTLDGFDIVAAVPAAATDGDPTTAFASMRRDLLPYFGLPFYRKMLERSGFGDDIAALRRRGGRLGRRWAPRSPTTSSRVLTAVGDDEGVRAGVTRYREAGATSPCVGPIPKTDFEATLRAAKP